MFEITGVLSGPNFDVLKEVDFFIQQGLLDEAAQQLAKLHQAHGAHPDVMNRMAMLKARGWDEQVAARPAEGSAAQLFSEEEQFFDLAAELEKELAEEDIVQTARGTEPSGDVSIEELFREFQRGVAEQVKEEDFDTHFNLGVAYREMGLLDEAIGEFQLALRSPEMFIDAASMIGSCYAEKGLPEQAAQWYERALEVPDLAMEAKMGLRYELGRAHEAAGNNQAALTSYVEVLALSPSFRDVVDRVARLKTN
jgi:tetratricopeptide (TPR) repeat protein